MVFIYVLQCEEDKYYIGKTDTNKFRIDTHFDSNGSEFTKKYKPIDIYQIIPECDKYDEDKYVKKYMDKYGINNVRGGTYSRIELTTEEKNFIQKELWGANDLCFLCSGEHFIKDCPMNKTEVAEENIESDLYIIDEDKLKIIKDKITNSEISFDNHKIKGWSLYIRNNNNRTHICEYFSFDNYTISEYISNDKEIMDLYKIYVDIYKDCWTNIPDPKDRNKKRLILDVRIIKSYDKSSIIRYKYLHEIENKIKQLIIKLSYIEIDKIINKLYSKNYVLFNFNLNAEFKKIINIHESLIYFKYFIEDYILDYNNGTRFDLLLFSKKDYNKYIKFQTIADIHITGELIYSADT